MKSPPPTSIGNPNHLFDIKELQLPDDILMSILAHLPAENVHRLKCVSKHWHYLICSPHFITAYLTLSPHLNRKPTWLVIGRDAIIPTSTGPYPGPNISFSLTQPPNITYLKISGLPRHVTRPQPPTVLNSSNGLILFPTQTDLLFVANPLTRDWAVLPELTCCLKMINLPSVALSAKLNKLVIIELQAPKDPTKEAATMLIFNSDIGQWDTRAAYSRAGSRVWEDMWQVDECLEANGRIFWAHLSRGLLVLDDPFGERMELRFIPLPEETVIPFLPSQSPELLASRWAYPVDGFVQFWVLKGGSNNLWRLTDVENGKWSFLYKSSVEISVPLRWDKVVLSLAAISPVDAELVVMTYKEKTLLINWRKGMVLDVGKRRGKFVKGEKQKNYYGVFLPVWPTPIPLSLGEKDKLKEATFHYSRSIYRLPTAASYANRAAANLKLGKYQKAENDCTDALKIDDRYFKVYVRRAHARKKLGKLWEAKQDAQIALKLHPEHQETMALYEEINCSLEKGM